MMQKLNTFVHIALFAAVASFPAAITLAAGPGDNSKFILTPAPGPEPRINGPKVYGARPGHPFYYRIPCTGIRPVKFSVDGLPASLHLDADTGIISGTTPGEPGERVLTLHATNGHGNSTRSFKLVVGDTLARTPPMGWNDWYTYYDRITEKVVRDAADSMISSGMADFGYQYVNIDDCWMRKPGAKDAALAGPTRGPSGTILPNGRFPDLPGLTAYIHDRGLRAGIYTGPGPLTCGGFEASYQHEAADARQFADWGFDFLKYDWCSYGKKVPPKSPEDYQKPYRLMGGILQKQDRDMVFNLCQYGMSNVWQWGASVGGHAWRTTGDLGLEKNKDLPGFYYIGFANAEHSENAGPGHWNDPDYILIGYIGDAFHSERDKPAQPTTLTPDEQYSYMSMWALMASPLIFSGDMGHLDPFTLNVLCNSEVIDIDQDLLGKQARIVRKTSDEFVLAKPLEDGGLAVGLFNLTKSPKPMTASWRDLGLKGRHRVRDAWRQHDLGTQGDAISASVAAHGVVLVRIAPAP